MSMKSLPVPGLAECDWFHRSVGVGDSRKKEKEAKKETGIELRSFAFFG